MHDVSEYEALFTKIPQPEDDHRNWMDGITRQRVRTTRAGDMLFVDSYPVYTSALMRQARAIAEKQAPTRETSEAQRRVNANHARRKLTELVCTNFRQGDILLTLTTRPDDPQRPLTAAAMKKGMDKYIRKIRTHCKKHALPDARYVYVIESTHSKKHGAQHHAHMIVNGDGMAELELRALWRSMHKDARVQTDRVWDRAEGLTSWSAYVTKGGHPDSEDQRQTIETCRRWYSSRGLKRPTVTVADKKLSRTRADKIARDFDYAGREIMAKLYPEHDLLNLSVHTSDYLPGAYIRAVFARKEKTNEPKHRNIPPMGSECPDHEDEAGTAGGRRRRNRASRAEGHPRP